MEHESTESQSSTEELMAKLTSRLAAAIVEGREAELARKLADAEKTIAELRAQASVPSAPREGRRTLPVSLLAKQEGTAPEPAALDAALASLSLEQRIAVKAQLLRSGLV
jgi:hypothetical protein